MVEAPFLRPSNISTDTSTDFEFTDHCVKWLEKYENYKPDIIVHLRPTQPCRKTNDLDACIFQFLKNRNIYDSLRTVIPFEKSPYKMYTLDSSTLLLEPLFKTTNSLREPYNQPRQLLPQCYLHNGYIDIFNCELLNNGTISGTKNLSICNDR